MIFESLNWSIPSKPLPHGINGMISVFVGAYVIITSLAGYLGHISNPAILGIYMYSSFANALSGLIMANIAPVAFQNLFRACAVFQMCLVYFVGRFSPLFPDATELGPALWILDCIFSIAIIAGIAWFATSAMTMVTGSRNFQHKYHHKYYKSFVAVTLAHLWTPSFNIFILRKKLNSCFLAFSSNSASEFFQLPEK